MLLFIGQIRPGADQVGAKICHGVLCFKKLLQQAGRLQRQTECIVNDQEAVGRSVIFGSTLKSNF